MSEEVPRYWPWADVEGHAVIHQATGVFMETFGVAAEVAMAHLALGAEAAGQTAVEFSWGIVHPPIRES